MGVDPTGSVFRVAPESTPGIVPASGWEILIPDSIDLGVTSSRIEFRGLNPRGQKYRSQPGSIDVAPTLSEQWNPSGGGMRLLHSLLPVHTEVDSGAYKTLTLRPKELGDTITAAGDGTLSAQYDFQDGRRGTILYMRPSEIAFAIAENEAVMANYSLDAGDWSGWGAPSQAVGATATAEHPRLRGTVGGEGVALATAANVNVVVTAADATTVTFTVDVDGGGASPTQVATKGQWVRAAHLSGETEGDARFPVEIFWPTGAAVTAADDYLFTVQGTPIPTVVAPAVHTCASPTVTLEWEGGIFTANSATVTIASGVHPTRGATRKTPLQSTRIGNTTLTVEIAQDLITNAFPEAAQKDFEGTLTVIMPSWEELVPGTPASRVKTTISAPRVTVAGSEPGAQSETARTGNFTLMAALPEGGGDSFTVEVVRAASL